MKIALISMPWAALDAPSLALSVLQPVARSVPGVTAVDVIYGNLAFMDFVMKTAGGDITADDYQDVADGYFVAAGEWIFSGALYDEPDPTATDFFSIAVQQDSDLRTAEQLYRLAQTFIEAYAQRLADEKYDLYGFSTSFLQNAPSLALAAALRRRDPYCKIIFGGANCDGVQGAAMHRNFGVIDYVVRGEGDVALAQLLRSLVAGDETFKTISGLCWRDHNDASIANPMTAAPLTMNAVSAPHFSDFFDALPYTAVGPHIQPFLVVEGSRGCWWGAKHHCTFCGLNGSLMAFRSKSADRLYREIVDAVGATQVLDIAFADNILDQAHLRDFMPMLQASGLDLRIFCEVKSNITFDQVSALADAGVVQIQPGIENLSSRVLRLMRKGVTGVRNIELLRNCETLGLEVSWNYLYGFPGERAVDYEVFLRQKSALIHLQPPSSASRIALERFSPYFQEESLGLVNRGPAKLFSSIFQLPNEELYDLIYLFESDPVGIADRVEKRLHEAVTDWRSAYQQASLVGTSVDRHVIIEDRRDDGTSAEYELGDVASAAYLCLSTGRSIGGLARSLRAEWGLTTDTRDLREMLDEWMSQGLIFQDDDDRYVALATGTDLVQPRCPDD